MLPQQIPMSRRASAHRLPACALFAVSLAVTSWSGTAFGAEIEPLGTFRSETPGEQRLRLLLRVRSASPVGGNSTGNAERMATPVVTFREIGYEDGTIWHQLQTIETNQLLIHVIDDSVPPPRRLLIGPDGNWQTLPAALEAKAEPPRPHWPMPGNSGVLQIGLRRTQTFLDPSQPPLAAAHLSTPCHRRELPALAQRKPTPALQEGLWKRGFPEELTLTHSPMTPLFRLVEWVCLDVATDGSR
jgi:hypothetical protein